MLDNNSEIRYNKIIQVYYIPCCSVCQVPKDISLSKEIFTVKKEIMGKERRRNVGKMCDICRKYRCSALCPGYEAENHKPRGDKTGRKTITFHLIREIVWTEANANDSHKENKMQKG